LGLISLRPCSLVSRDTCSPRNGRANQSIDLCSRVASMETYAYSVHALWHRGPANRTCIEPMNEEVSGKSAGAGRQERYDRCWRLAHRGLSLLKAGRKGEDMRGNGRCGERRTKALLEVYRVSEDPGRKLKGIEWARQRKRRRKHGTFSAVPSSRRSKEQDAAMIAALLSDVV